MNRTQALCKALGWQGGTIHQVAAETGCSVSDLLYSPLPEAETVIPTDFMVPFAEGWHTVQHQTLEYNKTRLFPERQGNLAFWLGVAYALMPGGVKASACGVKDCGCAS